MMIRIDDDDDDDADDDCDDDDWYPRCSLIHRPNLNFKI